MIADKEVTDRGEINFTGGADVTPIVDVFYGSLYQFAVGLTRSESDAADLVQQTFLSLIQRLHQIRDFSKIKCWLFTTLRRNFLIEVRRRRKCSEVEFLPDFHDFRAGDPEPWRSLDAQKVREALLQVDEAYRASVGAFLSERLFVQGNWRSSRNTDRHSDVAVVERQSATQIDPLKKFLWRWWNAKNVGVRYPKTLTPVRTVATSSRSRSRSSRSLI